MRILLLLSVCFLFSQRTVLAEPIQVLVWDERQPRQSDAYDDFIGNEIVARLKASSDDFAFRSVALDDAEQGLSGDNLDWADVLVWWGHVRQGEITPETASKKIVSRIQSGDLDLVVLHSAHWATPFMEAMNELTREIARERYPDPPKGRKVAFEFVPPPGRIPPDATSLVTPAYYALKRGGKVTQVRVDLPNCCFPGFRADGGPSTLKVMQIDHPIAKGLPKTISLKQSEMYDEPFHVPEPDAVILEERWESGEHFRSGMVWTVGKGKVFYLRPGHETYPIFKDANIIKVLENACRWLGRE
jgi:trehalose utilization protein